jgi:hypothetical protein
MWGWSNALVGAVSKSLEDHPYWGGRLPPKEADCGERPVRAVHLGVFAEPFLTWVLDGTKTVESRFSIHRQAPYGAVEPGDVIFLKRCAGPVIGVAEVGCVWDYRLNAAAWKVIKARFGPALRIEDPLFWKRKASACYATLMRLEQVTGVGNVFCAKRDRRAWVVLTARENRIGGRDGLP